MLSAALLGLVGLIEVSDGLLTACLVGSAVLPIGPALYSIP